ncbi:MAG: RluA family pseudouridine synthase [Clostridia bacterium]|nr:RluA family pseudouridine synthase [Clostridia bacterium]
MREFHINRNDAGQRLDKFLSKAVPLLPSSLLYKYIRTKRIKRNGGRCAISDRLVEGDVVTLYVNDEFFGNTAPQKPEFLYTDADVRVVYEDENILLADKPAGLLCHGDDSESRHTLIHKIQRYLYEKGEYDPAVESSFAPALCNRIDRNTAGIVIAAKNAEALRIMCDKIRDHEIEKSYKCIVHGRVAPPSGTLRGFLKKDAATNTVAVYSKPHPGALTAVTHYKTLKTTGGLSLLEVRLETGRTHQIRAQMAAAGHPLLGDTKYGTAALNRPYGESWQALCSFRVRFSFRTDAGILNYLRNRTFDLPPPAFERKYFG